MPEPTAAAMEAARELCPSPDHKDDEGNYEHEGYSDIPCICREAAAALDAYAEEHHEIIGQAVAVRIATADKVCEEMTVERDAAIARAEAAEACTTGALSQVACGPAGGGAAGDDATERSRAPWRSHRGRLRVGRGRQVRLLHGQGPRRPCALRFAEGGAVMTIQVQIHNSDDKRTIEVVAVEYNKANGTTRDGHVDSIGPGGSMTLYIHLLRDLRIREAHP